MSCLRSGRWCWNLYPFFLSSQRLQLSGLVSFRLSVPFTALVLYNQNLGRESSHHIVLQPGASASLPPAADRLLPFAPCSLHPLSHRRPGILVLVNDADWELLVSTSGDVLPLTASPAQPWVSHQAQRGWLASPLSHLASKLGPLKSPTPGRKEWVAGGSGALSSLLKICRLMCRAPIFLVDFILLSQSDQAPSSRPDSWGEAPDGLLLSPRDQGELDYQLQDQDSVLFISTLHGG